MVFDNELAFEKAFCQLLTTKGWESEILHNPSEKELLANWARILFENNRGIDRLNEQPLTDGEMQQIIESIIALRSPLALNGFINGKTISIKRDNPLDTLHYGKEVSLKVYDRREIAAGQSRYQIVRQPQFQKNNRILNDRRGDVMLLINGMPVFHLELKRSGIPVSQACHQIEKYRREGVFSGLFSLVQIFVALTPEECRYFANPGPDGQLNTDYFFCWADFDNEPINDYGKIAEKLLSIPMAHQLIGFYTVADNSDGILKVMRSYQYHAAHAISDKVSKTKWEDRDQRGGFIWHTTGSGKTMTSFKSAQLIANSGDADKVVFLTDRIELGTQSLKEYRNFAEASDSVQATENTSVLITKLKSKDTADVLIVTSIQKMSNIKEGGENIITADIALMNSKRLVFIVDEAHRSTFGDMLKTIKATFPKALFFGFTGTPIFDENQKKMSTTSDVFGDELHRYVIADGIRDKNVLGFDPYKVLTFKDKDVREVVALHEAKTETVEEALADPLTAKIFYHYMNDVPMYETTDAQGARVKGIEDYIPTKQYQSAEHQEQVVADIAENFLTLSHNFKFHAIFATSSIPEAIAYYRMLKEKCPHIKTTCLVDPNIDNTEKASEKSDGLVEIYEDYNARYGQEFSLSSSEYFKKDVALRLSHKEHYRGIEKTPAMQIDLLIVVDQMLTGFDSKWINTLYMDKKMEYANIIQAFSRTNRLFGHEKPFGTIRYYRRPHSMEQAINKAVKLYSGDRPVELFVPKLQHHLGKINQLYQDIARLFQSAGVPNLEKLPDEPAVKKEFAKLFKQLNEHLDAALIQGFDWQRQEYLFDAEEDEEGEAQESICMQIDETQYLILASRYKELRPDKSPDDDGSSTPADAPYDIVGYLTEIDTGRIDADYMNSRFEKYLRLQKQDDVARELLDEALDELHKTFATLTQEEQKFAELFMRDVDRTAVIPEKHKTLRDYITEYMQRAYDDQIHRCATALGLDEDKLRVLISIAPTASNLDEFNRFTELKLTVDKAQAKLYFESKENTTLPLPKVNQRIDKLLREFILLGGFEV